jgi:hypothetical protein
MGKRELLIIAAFICVGAIAYQLTASPAKPGERTFSLSRIFGEIKREIGSNASSAKVTKTGTIPVTPAVTEIRVSTFRSVTLTVIGEDRKDIGYELPVESTGPDEATAREWANKSDVVRDDLGGALALSVFFPEEGTQTGSLTVRVPKHLRVRVDNSGRIQVSGVGALELGNPAGEVTVSDVSGAVTGTHRAGELQVNGAGSVNLTLVSSRATIRNVTQGLTLHARSGECTISETSGPIDATVSNVELTITASKSSVKVGGDGGQVKIQDVHDLSIDVRRMIVHVETAIAPNDRLTIITTDEPARVALGASPSLVLDALAIGVSIRAPDLKLEPTKEERDSRLKTTLGAGGAHLVVRNTRGDIVIGLRK